MQGIDQFLQEYISISIISVKNSFYVSHFAASFYSRNEY